MRCFNVTTKQFEEIDIPVREENHDDDIIVKVEPTPEERIAALEKQNEMLQECLLELSEIIYA